MDFMIPRRVECSDLVARAIICCCCFIILFCDASEAALQMERSPKILYRSYNVVYNIYKIGYDTVLLEAARK